MHTLENQNLIINSKNEGAICKWVDMGIYKK